MKGRMIIDWVMVVIDGSYNNVHVIAQSLVQACNKYGMVWNYVP
jgi:hypothetical protein